MSWTLLWAGPAGRGWGYSEGTAAHAGPLNRRRGGLRALGAGRRPPFAFLGRARPSGLGAGAAAPSPGAARLERTGEGQASFETAPASLAGLPAGERVLRVSGFKPAFF